MGLSKKMLKSLLIASFLSLFCCVSSYNVFNQFIANAQPNTNADNLPPTSIDPHTKCHIDDYHGIDIHQIMLSKMRKTNPEWLPVDPNDQQVTVEGVVSNSKVAEADWPLYHNSHDLNFDLNLNNGYQQLASYGANSKGVIRVERDYGSIPTDFWPSVGDVAWIMGRWIYDCGHPPYETEIHPVFATAFSHTEPVIYTNSHEYTHITHLAVITHLWISGRGVYIDSAVPQSSSPGMSGTPIPAPGHYTFDVLLPPRPAGAPQPYAEVQSSLYGAAQAPPPRLTIDSSKNPNQPVLHVDYDLSSVTPSTASMYGVTIVSGWLDPVSTNAVHDIRVVMDSITINNCHNCNNWSMWLHVGTHWLVLADPMFSGQKPFCDIGKNNPVGACPPIGTIYFGPNAYLDVLIPDNQQAIGVQTSGFSWSKGDYASGAIGAPQGSVPTAQLESILLARLGHSEQDVVNRYLLGYLGLTYTDAANKFVEDMLMGVLFDAVNHEFSLKQNYGAGASEGQSLSYNDQTPSGDYSVAYHIINNGIYPANEPSTPPLGCGSATGSPAVRYCVNPILFGSHPSIASSAAQSIPTSSPVKLFPSTLKPSIPPALHPGFGYPGRQITKPPRVDDCCFLTGK